MSDTPRTNSEVNAYFRTQSDSGLISLCAQLERDLAAAQKDRDLVTDELARTHIELAAQTVRADERERIVDNLAAMLRRITWHINKRREVDNDGLTVLSGKAKELLHAYALEGNILRGSDAALKEQKP